MREGILKEGRLGKFGLPYNLIVGEQSWFLHSLIQYITIIEAKDLFYEHQVEYTGRSYLFDLITKEEEIPWYKIELNNSDHAIKEVTRQGLFKITNQEEFKEKNKEIIPAFSGEEIEILKGLIEKGNVS